MGEFPPAHLVWAFRGQNARVGSSPLLSSYESLHCWNHECYLLGCLHGTWVLWEKSCTDCKCDALENVAPQCWLGKSPAMCLNWMQSTVTFLDLRRVFLKLNLEIWGYELASATHALCNGQQNVFRFNVNSSWHNTALQQSWAMGRRGKICSVVMTRVLSFSSSAEHKIPLSSMREGGNEAVAGAGNQAGMGTSDQMLEHFANKPMHW